MATAIHRGAGRLQPIFESRVSIPDSSQRQSSELASLKKEFWGLKLKPQQNGGKKENLAKRERLVFLSVTLPQGSLPVSVAFFVRKKAWYVHAFLIFSIFPFYLSSIFLCISSIIFVAVSFPPSPIAKAIPKANAPTIP